MKVELDNKNEALLCFLFFLPQMNYYVAAILSSYGIQTITPLFISPHLNGHIIPF